MKNWRAASIAARCTAFPTRLKISSRRAAFGPLPDRRSSPTTFPNSDCEVYRKLTEAGAVLMGKTGMHELAYGITNDNPHFGAVRNPRDPARIPGGSSGGSGAAVAAELVFFAMGTDTGGSIRIPGRLLRMRGTQADVRTL